MSAIDELAAKAAEQVIAGCRCDNVGDVCDDAGAEEIIAAAIREGLREPLEALRELHDDAAAWTRIRCHKGGESYGNGTDAEAAARAILAKWGAR